ncbi:MAG: hypothetical protein ACYTKC_22455 [Planctomycetota bacterium]|jgi:hypothetical protein
MNAGKEGSDLDAAPDAGASRDPWLEVSLAEVIGGSRPPDLHPVLLRRIRRRRMLRAAAAVAAVVLLSAATWFMVQWLRGELAAPGPDTAPPTAEERQSIEAQLALMSQSLIPLPPQADSTRELSKRIWNAQLDFLELVRRRPPCWDHARPILLAQSSRQMAFDVKFRWHWLLAHDVDATSTARIVAALAEQRSDFDEATLLLLAERGVDPAEEILLDRVSPQAGVTALLPAAWLHMRGDARGVRLLRRALRNASVIAGRSDWYLGCGLALTNRGEAGAWQVVFRNWSSRIDGLLGRQELQGARDLVLFLEWVHQRRSGQSSAVLVDLRQELALYARARYGQLPDAGSVRRRLAALAQ